MLKNCFLLAAVSLLSFSSLADNPQPPSTPLPHSDTKTTISDAISYQKQRTQQWIKFLKANPKWMTNYRSVKRNFNSFH